MAAELDREWAEDAAEPPTTTTGAQRGALLQDLLQVSISQRNSDDEIDVATSMFDNVCDYEGSEDELCNQSSYDGGEAYDHSTNVDRSVNANDVADIIDLDDVSLANTILQRGTDDGERNKPKSNSDTKKRRGNEKTVLSRRSVLKKIPGAKILTDIIESWGTAMRELVGGAPRVANYRDLTIGHAQRADEATSYRLTRQPSGRGKIRVDDEIVLTGAAVGEPGRYGKQVYGHHGNNDHRLSDTLPLAVSNNDTNVISQKTKNRYVPRC